MQIILYLIMGYYERFKLWFWKMNSENVYDKMLNEEELEMIWKTKQNKPIVQKVKTSRKDGVGGI